MKPPQCLKAHPVVDIGNQLGWDMVSQLCDDQIPSGGTAVSPLSINIALAMLAGGAEPATCQALCAKLGVENPAQLVAILPQLLDTLSDTSESTRFQSANAFFADKSAAVFESYIDYLRSLGTNKIDEGFPSLAQGTEQINGWVSGQTDGLILNLLSPDILAQSHMVLINALIFKAAWETEFDPRKTVKDFPFHITNQKTSAVDMMFLHQQHVPLCREEDYTAIRLAYAGTSPSRWSFVAYLPHENKTLSDIIPRVRAQGTNSSMFVPTKVSKLGLPMFNLQTKDTIKSALEKLGYPLSTNFSAMGTGSNLVEHIIHSVTIVMDEKGTEAAAATAAVMTRSLPMPSPTIIFDRPFAFSIVAEDTGLVLFAGVFSK